MATYETSPVRHEHHVVERDSSSSSGVWAVLAVIIVLLALILFGSRFLRTTNDNGAMINGTVNTPSGTYEGTGTVK